VPETSAKLFFSSCQKKQYSFSFFETAQLSLEISCSPILGTGKRTLQTFEKSKSLI